MADILMLTHSSRWRAWLGWLGWLGLLGALASPFALASAAQRPSLLASGAVAAQAAQPTLTDTEIQLRARRIAVGTCAACHGREGRSSDPKFPVLAAQRASYLEAQLKAFRSRTRGDPDAVGYMWGMAEPLDDALIAALADYYSRQAAMRGEPRQSPLLAQGMRLYREGDAAAGIPPCAACHGAQAEGTAMYPRLAGQHAQYLIKQLRSFRSNLRDVAVMHGVAQGLKLHDMSAVALYLQSLGP